MTSDVRLDREAWSALAERFLEGFRTAPDLKYAAIDGMGHYCPDAVEYLAEFIAGDKPRSETRIEKFAARFFFGYDVAALPRFQSVCEFACKAVRQKGLVGADRTLPEPYPFLGESVPEHEWLFFLSNLGETSPQASFAPVRGPITADRLRVIGGEGPLMIALPNGDGIPRCSYEGRGEEWDGLLSAVQGKGVHITVKGGHFVAATIFDVSVWNASADALRVLGAQWLRPGLAKPPELAPPPGSPQATATQTLAPARHSDDFRSVHWFGKDYQFTPTQAAAVKVLWTAWEKGTPELSQEAILEQAGSAGRRLADVFRNHKGGEARYHQAWGRMIVPGTSKGSYRLREPEGHSA